MTTAKIPVWYQTTRIDGHIDHIVSSRLWPDTVNLKHDRLTLCSLQCSLAKPNCCVFIRSVHGKFVICMFSVQNTLCTPFFLELHTSNYLCKFPLDQRSQQKWLRGKWLLGSKKPEFGITSMCRQKYLV